MKKFLAFVMAASMALSLAACGGSSASTATSTTTEATSEAASAASTSGSKTDVAFVTDVGNIDDQSFNQYTWQGVQDFCSANNLSANYYRPTEDSDAARLEQMDNAVNDGAKSIVVAGYLFGSAIAEAQEKYPDVQFRHCKMNPISLDSKLPPGVTLQMNMYSLLEKSTEQKNTVNLIGINTVAKNGDLRDILAQKGYRLLHISEYDRFEDFREMSSSKLDILAGPAAKMASKDMEKNLGIPTVEGYVTYREQDIDAFYTRLSEALGEELLPLTAPYRDKARQKIDEAKAVIGDYPIAVDYQAVLRPFSLALMLAENGFRVAMVASDGIPAFEQENYEKLMLLVNPLHHDSVKFGLTDKDFLCIGFDCGYITASDKVANLMEDDYMYGYDGVCRLMDMLIAAFNEKADVSEMIEKAGPII